MRYSKQIFSSLLIVIASLPVFAQTDLIQYLPENASAVISVNSNRLKQKMTWEELSETNFFKTIAKDAPADKKIFLTNPDSLGIDKSQGILIAIVNDKSEPKKGYGVAYVKMRNAKQFGAAMQKFFKNRSVKTIGNNKILIDNDVVFGWNNNLLVVSVQEKNKELTTAKTASEKATAAKNISRMQTDRCVQLLTPGRTNSYAKDKRFTDLIADDADIRYWSAGGFSPLRSLIGRKAPALQSNAFSKGSFKATVINFENGKVICQTRNYLNRAIDSVYQKFQGNNINTELAGRLPNGQVLAYISLNYPSALYKALFETAGMKELMKEAFKKESVSGGEYMDAFKGDIALAVIKTQEPDPEDSVAEKMGGLKIFLSGSIGDKTKFEKLMQSIKNPKDSASSSGKTEKFLSDLREGIQYNDNFFVVSLSPRAASQYLNTAPAATPAWLQPYASQPIVMSIDLNAIFGFAMQLSQKSNKQPEAQDLIRNFDRLISYGGNYTNGCLNNTVEIRLIDKNENSLKQMIGFLGAAVEESMKSKSHKGTQ